MTRVPLTVLAVALAAAGCAADTDERPADFPYIASAILRPGCGTATCHSAMTNREELDFSTVESSARAMDEGLVPIGGTSDPYDTELMHVLTTSGEDRMPIDSPLPQADLDLIATWIMNGAVR